MKKRYWTRQELIDYFRHLAYRYDVEAHRNNDLLAKGKAEAYEQAAFELEHNTKPEVKEVV